MIGSSNWKQTPNHTGEFGSISLGASAAWLGAAYAQRYAVEVNRLHDMAAIMVEILRGYTLPVRGDHGLFHWARVLVNGLRVAETNGADRNVVALFALFHDSRRVNEFHDDGHPPVPM